VVLWRARREATKVPKKGHSEEKILRALHQAEGGEKVADICRELALSRRASLAGTADRASRAHLHTANGRRAERRRRQRSRSRLRSHPQTGRLTEPAANRRVVDVANGEDAASSADQVSRRPGRARSPNRSPCRSTGFVGRSTFVNHHHVDESPQDIIQQTLQRPALHRPDGFARMRLIFVWISALTNPGRAWRKVCRRRSRNTEPGRRGFS
jgi:hypothetical protein